MTLVGSVAATAASASTDPLVPASRASWASAWMRRKRSAIGMSPVGTSIRARENAFAPDESVRVLMAMLERSSSTGLPISR